MTIDYQALREAAERAIPAMERLLMLPADDDLLSEQELKDYGVDIDALNAFKFLAGPETVLALLDELERNQQYIKRRDQENEEIALTVGRLRVELEGKDSKIANLTAERDALREGEMGDARHSNTRAAADIYFQLVEECEIPAGGSLVEYVDDMREKLEAAEKRIAELEAEPVSQTYKLNQLSGNSPATPDGWIPVSERMPEPYEYVLVTDGFDGCEVMRVNTDGYWGPAKSLYPGSITHWMPLPAAPQQEVK